MIKKIVIASDSFKGSLTSGEVAESIATAIHEVLPACEVIKVPVADGGEGTVEALITALHGKSVDCIVHDPLMNLINATYSISDDGKTAIIEMASASGITLLPLEKHNPWLTTTYGTGELIKDALLKGCTNFLIGIGGSATNDAGTGMLQALGYVFYDFNHKQLGLGGRILEQIGYIDASNALPQLQDVRFTIACDVSNPFSGKDGAACIFAPQKGADEQMVKKLDAGLKHFASIIKEQLSKDIDSIPGAGAAGGLGGAFLAFLPSTLKSGIQMVLDTIEFERIILGADLIFTGEGKLDDQTVKGKTPAGVLKVARRHNVPVIALGGNIQNADLLNDYGFQAVFPILPAPVSLEKAMEKKYAKENIRKTVKQIVRTLCAL